MVIVYLTSTDTRKDSKLDEDKLILVLRVSQLNNREKSLITGWYNGLKRQSPYVIQRVGTILGRT